MVQKQENLNLCSIVNYILYTNLCRSEFKMFYNKHKAGILEFYNTAKIYKNNQKQLIIDRKENTRLNIMKQTVR